MSETLYRVTTGDAEAILGRKLRAGEASSIRKTLEFALEECVLDAIQSHEES